MQLAELTWPAVQALNKDTPVVFPIAALEQHGHHLPLFTDSLLLGEIIHRTAERVGDRVLFAPLTWLGNSDHHLDFPGTLSAPPRTYLDLLGGLFVWTKTVIRMARPRAELVDLRLSVELCTVYWHYLLLVWLVLFAVLLSN